jgi:hypothetical protein
MTEIDDTCFKRNDTDAFIMVGEWNWMIRAINEWKWETVLEWTESSDYR